MASGAGERPGGNRQIRRVSASYGRQVEPAQVHLGRVVDYQDGGVVEEIRVVLTYSQR
ncbi:MAG: hypothetical protein L0322_11740 [Chloroflexi bacterium]|nr:hypothetical protein [Chloroflexota bacterium]